MMKQARTLLSRSLCNPSSSLFEGKVRAWTVRGFATSTASSNSGNGLSGQDVAKYSSRVIAPYAIFKGKAALSVEPVSPSFTKLDSGSLRLKRGGSLMMTFMPAIGERKYDWEKRQKFALSPTEIGSLIAMGPSDSSEFFHDPSLKSSNAGQVRKSLSIKPHADGSGYFISLTVNNSILKTNDRIVVPVTKAEFAVMKTNFSFALPHLTGWDRSAAEVGTAAETNTSYPNTDPHQLSLEWNK